MARCTQRKPGPELSQILSMKPTFPIFIFSSFDLRKMTSSNNTPSEKINHYTVRLMLVCVGGWAECILETYHAIHFPLM